MPAYKDSKQGTWYASFYFENWQGVKQKKLKRGFATKKDALAWEREFLLQQAADLTMTFEAYKALRDQMKLIYQELQRLAVDEEVPPDLLETLQMVALTLNGLKEECE